jgi:hypothetical protein
MIHRIIRLALISLAFMVSFSQLSAQNTVGSISGNVQGATANTTVIVIDTNRNIERAAVLSDSGTFDVNNLSPGAYQVEVRVGGTVIDTVTVLVRIDSTTSVNMATTQNFIEEILVTGNRIASIDTGIAESGLVVISEELELLPVGRSLNSVALLTAGASGGDTAFGGVAFSGSSVAENQVYINGLNVTNFRTGVGFGYVPFEFLSQVQTRSGGYGPQYGR